MSQLTCCPCIRWDRSRRSCRIQPHAGLGRAWGVSACTKAPKDVPTVESKGTSPQGLLQPSSGQTGREGAPATPVLGAGCPLGQKGHLSPDTPMQQHPSVPCPLAAKQEPALDAPHPMDAGLMPVSPVSPVSTRLPPMLGIAPPAQEVPSPACWGRGGDGAGEEMGLCGVTHCNMGLDRHRAKGGHMARGAHGRGARGHLCVFSHKRNRAEMGNFLLA